MHLRERLWNQEPVQEDKHCTTIVFLQTLFLRYSGVQYFQVSFKTYSKNLSTEA